MRRRAPCKAFARDESVWMLRVERIWALGTKADMVIRFERVRMRKYKKRSVRMCAIEIVKRSLAKRGSQRNIGRVDDLHAEKI